MSTEEDGVLQDQNSDILNHMSLEWDDEVAHEETIVEVNGEDDYIEVEEDGTEGYLDMEDPRDFDNMSPEAAAALLPIRDGRIVFSLNLPDLISQQRSLSNGACMYLCFSKKCTRQLAFDGYIYNISGCPNPMNYNIWRCATKHCSGAVRSSPNYESLTIRSDHMDGCLADDAQVRLRIAIYDLRLMAEFTDIPLLALYSAFVEKMRSENSDIAHLIPEYEKLRPTLEIHRNRMIYRRRFEIRRQLYNHKRNMGEIPAPDSVPFKRTKAFPPSICVECHLELYSNDYAPSHDLLVEHLNYQHNRPMCIERFTFPDAKHFEQWIRELQMYSRYRLRKLGLYDEHMYYLCQSDDRQQRCNHGKGTIFQMQCSAFVRVHDWRFILRREIKPVVVDYCLDHTFHTGTSPCPDSRQPIYDYFSPDVFMKDLERRRVRTDALMYNSQKLQRVKRPPYQRMSSTPTQLSTVAANGGRVYKSSYKADSLIEAADNGQPTHYANSLPSEVNSERFLDILDDDGSEWSTMADVSSHHKNGASAQNEQPHLEVITPPTTKTSSRLAREIDEQSRVDALTQIDQQCDALKHRLEHCRRGDVARRYLVRITSIVDDILADPACAPRSIIENVHDGPQLDHVDRDDNQYEDEENGDEVAENSAPMSIPSSSNPNPPPREAMVLKRDASGRMILVKRTLRQIGRGLEGPEEPVAMFNSTSSRSTASQPGANKKTADTLIGGSDQNPSGPTELPVKRKRGRPRRYDT